MSRSAIARAVAIVVLAAAHVAAQERPGADPARLRRLRAGLGRQGRHASGRRDLQPDGRASWRLHHRTDEALGETWYFLAPRTVLDRLPDAVNGTLSYSLKQSGSIISLFDDDVVIVGPAGRLSYRFPIAPGTDWTDFSVRLSASAGWTWNWNAPATQAQIESVLKAPALLQIRGEYVTGEDMGWLDSFRLAARP